MSLFLLHVLLYLLALPLLTSSKPAPPLIHPDPETPPSSPPSSPPPQRSYMCFNNRELHTIYQSDCGRALQQIIKADKSQAPMTISRTTGFIVPHNWNFGSCVIYINTSNDVWYKSVTLPLETVAEAALHVMGNCIVDLPRYTGKGGATSVESVSDSGGKLDVVILGTVPPDWSGPGPFPPASRVPGLMEASKD